MSSKEGLLSALTRVQVGYMGMSREWLVPEMIRDPQELEERHRGEDKGTYHFFSNCPNVLLYSSNAKCCGRD